MPLNNTPILVMCDDPQTAHALVNEISAARGDILFAADRLEAHQRLQQFQVSAAVLAWQIGVDAVAATLRAHGVPFYVFGPPVVGVAAVAGALVVVDIDEVVPQLVALLLP
jgi:hypothetical protein